jgi:hypothetical protein
MAKKRRKHRKVCVRTKSRKVVCGTPVKSKKGHHKRRRRRSRK